LLQESTITIIKLRGLRKDKTRGKGKIRLSANHQQGESLNGISPDHKENYIQTASLLHAFAGENAMSVFEVATTLDTAQTKIVELEKKLSTQKDDYKKEIERALYAKKDEITSEFERVDKAIENLHTEELQKALQAQKDEMNAKFEKRTHSNQNLHKA
jgi:hypothetical protein